MPTLVKYNFSKNAEQAIHIARRIAKENMHATYGAAHLLKALLHKDLPLLKFLEANDVDVYYVEEWAEIRIEEYPRSSRVFDEPEEDDTMEAVFHEAEHLQTRLHYTALEPECLLIALSTPGVAFAYEQLKTYPLSSSQLLQWFEKDNTTKGNGTTPAAVHRTISANLEALNKYGIDKMAQARNGQLYPVIGRDKEIRQVCEIVSRKSKSNVIISGDPGVGKTALLNGFAMAVANESVPLHLRNVA
ncbi:MAG TPA: AAA family ATPase, partial [Flavisolibacter sp.]|nr:AAA family ATPase [Flavisolibacter sp.]